MDPTGEPPSSEIISYKAAHAVLNTHELLHDIIVRLPVKDLVVATGVCHTWHKLKNSVAIQQALFLVPVEVVDIMSDADLCLSTRLEDIPRSQYSIVGKTHSHLVAFTSEKPRFDWRIVVNNTLVGNFESKSLSRHPLGCWRDMFTSQPPTTTIGIVLIFDPRYQREARREVFTRKTGVKMGELHVFFLSELYSNPWALKCRAEPKGFIDPKGRTDVNVGGRWEVRGGKVHRQTQLRRDTPEEESSSDEEMLDEEMFPR
jgi:hypothetical protein